MINLTNFHKNFCEFPHRDLYKLNWHDGLIKGSSHFFATTPTALKILLTSKVVKSDPKNNHLTALQSSV